MMDWTAAQVERITDTVARAPSVHNMRPWTLRFRPGRVELCERSEVALPRHDPDGRDRLISCGAAIANLELAVRHVGLRTSLALLPDEDRPSLVACLHVLGRGEPRPAVEGRYAAIFRRHSYRAPFGTGPVEPALREALTSERGIAHGGDVWGVQLRTVDSPGELSSLAGLLAYAGSVLRADSAYQRELVAWSGQDAGGMPPPVADTLPWVGLVRRTTHLPDVPTLTERLRRELVLLVLTVDDGRVDHVRAGIVLQRTWLTAITAGLVASVHTQALQLHEIRAGLIEQLGLAGYPQLIMRFGSPLELTATAPTASATEAP